MITVRHINPHLRQIDQARFLQTFVYFRCHSRQALQIPKIRLPALRQLVFPCIQLRPHELEQLLATHPAMIRTQGTFRRIQRNSRTNLPHQLLHRGGGIGFHIGVWRVWTTDEWIMSLQTRRSNLYSNDIANYFDSSGKY